MTYTKVLLLSCNTSRSSRTISRHLQNDNLDSPFVATLMHFHIILLPVAAAMLKHKHSVFGFAHSLLTII